MTRPTGRPRGRPPLAPGGTEVVRARVTAPLRVELDLLAAEHGGESGAIRWLLEQSAKRRATRGR